jgi:hypothetical protein
MKKIDVAVILLTYKRIGFFDKTCKMLANQTNKNFHFFVLDASNEHNKVIDITNQFLKKSNVEYFLLDQSKDEDTSAWRRHIFAGKLAKDGYKKIIFIDDDIVIPNNFIELALSKYEEKSFKSWWAFKINDIENYLEKRTRVLDPKSPVNYCAPNVAILDASIFLDDNYFKLPSEEFIWVEDLWISYYAQQVMKWKLSYLDIDGISFDEYFSNQFAIWHMIRDKTKTSMNKNGFVKFLIKDLGWKIN